MEFGRNHNFRLELGEQREAGARLDILNSLLPLESQTDFALLTSHLWIAMCSLPAI